jgi:hypothetical protein
MPDLFRTPDVGFQPQPIPAEWHPQLGARLSVFPRNVIYAERSGAGYWPDLATFVEDAATRQMMYTPSTASAYSLRVVFHKHAGLWETFKYRDAELVGYSRGVTFTQAMNNAVLLGPQPDEA